MGRTLLFATDGSEPSDRALEHLLNYSRQDDEIVVVHVMPNPDEGYLGNTYESVIAENELRSSAEELIETVVDSIREQGLQTRSRILKGHTGQAICELADELKADGIVVGRKGHSALAETLLGSVSQYLIHHAPVPVIVVP